MNDREYFEAWFKKNYTSSLGGDADYYLELEDDEYQEQTTQNMWETWKDCALETWQACAESKKSELDKANARIAQLEAYLHNECGGLCNAEYNPCAAQSLLAESPDIWLSQHDKAVEVNVLEYVFVNAVRDGCNKYTGDDVVETIKYMIESRK